jgi:VWFA-related protein
MRLSRLVVAMIVLFSAVMAFAAQFGETLEVRLIEIPVTVVDRAGKSVAALTQADFEVYDEGKRVPIRSFEVVDMAEGLVNTAVPLPPAAYRNFVLLFDIANSSRGTIGRAQDAAHELVKSQMSARDLVAVATFTVERGIQVVTNFTNDRELLDQAIDTLGSPSYFKVADPLRLTFEKPPEARPGTRSAVKEEALDAMEAFATLTNEVATARHDEEMRDRLRTQLTQFAGLARVLDAVRGQKEVILLSEGFDPKLVQGRQDLSFRATQKQNSAVEHGEIWNVGTDDRFGSASSSNEVNRMAELFKRSDVTMYAIDIKGLRTNVDAREGAGVVSNEGLDILARPTGGRVFKNATDLSKNFAELIEQQRNLYVLTIAAQVTKAGAFHDLKVKVAGNRGVRVNAKSGYYEESTRKSALEQTLTLADIMMTDTPVSQVPLTVFAMPLPSRAGGARVPVVVEIPGGGITSGVTSSKATTELYVYAFDEMNQVADFLQQRIGLDLVKSGETLHAGGVRYVGMLRLPPGKYGIKALVRVDETGRVGFRRTNIEIAEKQPTVLPPLFFQDLGGWINVAAPGRSADVISAFSASGSSYAPAPLPRVKADGSYKLALFVHDVPMENLQIAPAVIGQDGARHEVALSLLGRTAADADGAAKLLFDFKPTALDAGTYRLQLTVTAHGGSPAVVAAPFIIE